MAISSTPRANVDPRRVALYRGDARPDWVGRSGPSAGAVIRIGLGALALAAAGDIWLRVALG